MDNVQAIVDFLHKRLLDHNDNGQRVLVFSKGANGKGELDATELPKAFEEYCELNNFKWNHLEVELLSSRKRDAWISHKTAGLESYSVCEVFLAVKPSDRNKKLANIEFVWRTRKDSGERTRFYPLNHMSSVAIDARKHSKLSCKHRVVGMPTASLRLTMTNRRTRNAARTS